jgi:phage baseplate assembly protein W
MLRATSPVAAAIYASVKAWSLGAISRFEPRLVPLPQMLAPTCGCDGCAA